MYNFHVVNFALIAHAIIYVVYLSFAKRSDWFWEKYVFWKKKSLLIRLQNRRQNDRVGTSLYV